MQQFDVAKNTAYEASKRGVNGLFEAEFNYTQFVESSQKIEFVRSRFVQKISYVDDLGLVKLVFANDVVPLIVGLKKFTKYEIEQIKGLQSHTLFACMNCWLNGDSVKPIKFHWMIRKAFWLLC